MRYILASSSPRRNQLLSWVGLDFEVIPSAFDESLVEAETSDELVEELALQKALAVERDHPGHLILAADTMVELDGQRIGKASDEAGAKLIITTLAGSTHQVYTGVAILEPSLEQPLVFHEVSEVTFRPLSEAEIDEYLATNVWRDKAGAYGIQEDPGKFITGYQGSYTNILGLPMGAVMEQLAQLDVPISGQWLALLEAQTGRRER